MEEPLADEHNRPTKPETSLIHHHSVLPPNTLPDEDPSVLDTFMIENLVDIYAIGSVQLSSGQAKLLFET